MNGSFNHQRITTLQSNLGKDLSFFYLTHPLDLFYFTGLDLSTGILIISEHEAKLLVDPRYIAKAKLLTGITVIPLAEKESHLPKADSLNKIGFVSKRTTVSEYFDFPPVLREFLTPIDPLISEIRSIKDPDEIKLLMRAAKISEMAFLATREKLHSGISEKELASAYLSHATSQGASGGSFSPIVAFGKNSAYPHHRAGDSLFQEELVLFDLGVMAEAYASDMTRCDLTHNQNALLAEDYKIVKEAYEIAFSLAKVGACVSDLDLAVKAYLKKWDREQLFTHSLGHGIGLEVHEYPRLHSKGPDCAVILKENMVITIEPGLYRAGLGGIRLENTVLITSKGPEALNKELPL